MPLVFYPHPDDAKKGGILERIEVLLDAAERYKAVMLDANSKSEVSEKKSMIPRDQAAAYNWDEIAQVLRQIREAPEGTRGDKLAKATMLAKLAEVYEVLRAAKMSKLEAVRLALISEANQLKG